MMRFSLMLFVFGLTTLTGCGYRYGCEAPRCVPLPKNEERPCPRLCGEQRVDYCFPGNYMY